MKTTRLLIERKQALPEWEIVAYPSNDEDVARALLERMKDDECKKRYGNPLRLIRETREVLAT